MGYIAFFSSIILTIISIKDNKGKIVMPKTLFYLLWSFILFLSILNLYNIIKPSSLAYILVILMLVFYFIGDYLAKYKIKKIPLHKKVSNVIEKIINSFNRVRKKYNKEPKYIIIYILAALVIIFTLIDCAIVIKHLLNGVPMYKIRRWRMGAYGIDSNPILDRRTFAEEIFRSVILSPFETLMPPIAAYTCFKEKEKKSNKYILLVLSIIILGLSSLAGGGGRLGFIYYFGSFLLAFLVSLKNNNKIDAKKCIKYILIILIFGFVAIICLTKFRTTSSFFKQVYTYFAMPPTLLSLWLPKITEVEHTYGLLTTFGIHSYIFRGFDAIGLDFLVPNIYNNTFQHLLNAEKFIQAGFGVANAFVTPIYYFMIDGGIPFVCFASMFFGYIISKFYNALINKIDIKKFVLYTLIMYGIFLTFIRIQTAIPSFIISFIFAIILLDTVEEEKTKEGRKKTWKKKKSHS